MKIKIILFAFAIFTATACENKKNQDPVADPAIQMLTEFYTAYIIEFSKSPQEYNPKAIEALKQKYMTETCLKKWIDAELDYDPILNAQDCDTSWIKTLKIDPVAEQKDVYTVCYLYDEDHKNCMTLHLVNRNGKYMIDNIGGLEATAENENTDSTDGSNNRILIPAMYRNYKPEDFKHLLSEEWFDFYEQNGIYYLQKARIHVGKSYDDCLGDSTTTVLSSHEESILLIKATPRLTPGKLSTFKLPVNYVWPYESYTFPCGGKNYTLRAQCTTPKETIGEQKEEGNDWGIVKGYQLYLSVDGSKEQLLLEVPEFNDTFVQILWVGDIDQDGKPDFIFDTSPDYEYKRIEFFLSSEAEGGEIVKKAGVSEYGFDC